jgi:hypothetical protein
MKTAAAIEKQSMYPITTMTGTGCDSSQEIITAPSPVGGMKPHHYQHLLSPEIVPLLLFHLTAARSMFGAGGPLAPQSLVAIAQRICLIWPAPASAASGSDRMRALLSGLSLMLGRP